MRLAAAAILLLALCFSFPAKAQTFSDNYPQASHWFGNVVAPAGQPGKLGPKPRASCGWYMRGQFGGRYGKEFNRAMAWARLPRVSPRPGAVVVQTRKGKGCGGQCGHVSKIKQVISACRAIVQDNRGTYERDICKNRVAVVQP